MLDFFLYCDNQVGSVRTLMDIGTVAKFCNVVHSNKYPSEIM